MNNIKLRFNSIIYIFILSLIPLSILHAQQPSSTYPGFILKVTASNPKDHVYFSGKIMQMTANGLVPYKINAVTPYECVIKTSFFNVNLHPALFSQKIRVAILTRENSRERLWIDGIGDDVVLEAGSNGHVYASSRNSGPNAISPGAMPRPPVFVPPVTPTFFMMQNSFFNPMAR